jgi:division protein CdvB (Snf7/Vps24/ESCRT-III family)
VVASVVEDRLQEKIAERLGLTKPAEPAASAATSPEASKRPEDKLKERLRGLLGR